MFLAKNVPEPLGGSVFFGFGGGSVRRAYLLIGLSVPRSMTPGKDRGIVGWSSLVARLAHNQEVGGSNPPPAPKFEHSYHAVR